MRLDGFVIGGFRSFGPTPVRIGNLGKINVFIGANNSGKSNVLRFCKLLSTIDWSASTRAAVALDSLDYNLSMPNRQISWGYQLRRNSEATGDMLAEIQSTIPKWDEVSPDTPDEFWIEYSTGVGSPTQGTVTTQKILADALEHRLSSTETNHLTNKLRHYSGGSQQQRANDVAGWIVAHHPRNFPCIYIPAFRQVVADHEKPRKPERPGRSLSVGTTGMPSGSVRG